MLILNRVVVVYVVLKVLIIQHKSYFFRPKMSINILAFVDQKARGCAKQTTTWGYTPPTTSKQKAKKD